MGQKFLHTVTGKVRLAHPDEKDSLLEFYQKNPDPFLLPRPAPEFEQAVEEGRYFVIEVNGEIIAASGIFDYDEAQPFVELAETRVIKDWQGYRLQGLLFRLRIASVILGQGKNTLQITTAIDPENEISRKTMKSINFQEWKEIIPEAFNSCPTCPNRTDKRDCCCDYFILPTESKKQAVSTLLTESKKKEILMTNKHGQELILKCECRMLIETERRLALKEFCAS